MARALLTHVTNLSVILLASAGIQCSSVDYGESTATTRSALTSSDIETCRNSGLKVIIGTSNNDVLVGTPGPDCIVGLGGQDIIDGGGGDDIIFGGDGDDIINAGPGNDRVSGGRGQDRIYGGDGNDTLMGDDGDDQLFGEGGDDMLTGGQGQDRLSGGAGNDNLMGGPGDDTLAGDSGNDVLNDCNDHNRFDGGTGTNSCRGDSPASSFMNCAAVMPCASRQARLDQSFTSPSDLSDGLFGPPALMAQSYTAGISGTLQGVAIDVTSFTQFVARIQIETVVGGVPSGIVLGQARASRSGNLDINTIIPLPGTVPQVAGQQYAIIVDYPEAPPFVDNAPVAGEWNGSTGNVYPAGTLLSSFDNGATWISFESQGFDVHFQTFVIPN